MQHGMVDLVLVGCDRATRKGDVANKIGTYLKALAAFDNRIPFYSALPSSSIDFDISNGLAEIFVEGRDPEEVTTVSGLSGGKIESVRICPENAIAANFGFDVTPARLITGLITEKGICQASEEEINKLFSDKFI
jgi:methylthioribose-1-phosphate isomerase